LTLYDDIIEYLEGRGLCFVRKFVPYFLCSFGDHLFNMVNKQYAEDGTPLAIYWENQEVPDMRLFILFLAPSGFSKSTFLRHLLKGYFGIFSETIETTFKAYMTEAHLTGSTSRGKEGEARQFKGFLETHPNAIVGVEEFSTLLTAMKQEHSLGMDSVLLDWFTHGEIKKGLSAGEIAFVTNATLWAGTQLGRERIEIHGGMMRRFFLMLWVPTEQDIQILMEAVINAPEQGPLDLVRLRTLRAKINNIMERLDDIYSVQYSPELNDWFREHLVPNEVSLFRKLALGYNIIKGEFSNEIYVDIDDELKRLMDTAKKWRNRVYLEINERTGMGTDMIVQILKHAPNKELSFDEIALKMLIYEVSYSETSLYIQELKRQGRVMLIADPENNKMRVRLLG